MLDETLPRDTSTPGKDGGLVLYGMSSPNVIKVILMLEELAEPYRLVKVDVFAGDQHEPSFRSRNPNGKVPVLVDQEGPGGSTVNIFESGAILIYLAEKHHAFLPEGGNGRYAVLQWLMLQMSGLGPAGGQAIHFTVLNDTDLYARQRFTIELERQLGVLDQRLSDNAYLAGEHYSIADMAAYPWVSTLTQFFPAMMRREGLSRWFDAIGDRPAARRAAEIARQLGIENRRNMKAATPQMLDRYFGRIVAE